MDRRSREAIRRRRAEPVPFGRRIRPVDPTGPVQRECSAHAAWLQAADAQSWRRSNNCWGCLMSEPGGWSRPPRESAIRGLTDREQEVLSLMAEGMSNNGISAAMYVSAKTVEVHIGSIFAKLGLEPAASQNRRVGAVLAWLSASRSTRADLSQLPEPARPSNHLRKPRRLLTGSRERGPGSIHHSRSSRRPGYSYESAPPVR